MIAPDLPAPVVPATSRCGILARSAPIERPATSLPSHTVSGDQSGGGAWKTSPRWTIRRRAFGTSMPTACLPGIGARMRISDAASAYARSSLSCATLRDLDPRRQPQLVAGDVRPGDHPDHARVDVEVPERLDQLRGDLLLPGGVGPRGVLGRARELGRVGQLPDEVGRVGDLGPVAALRRELLGLGGLRRPARDALLVLRRILGEALELCDRLGLGLRFRLGLEEIGERFLLGPLRRFPEHLGPLHAHARRALERRQVIARALHRPPLGGGPPQLARGRADRVRRGLDHARDRRARHQQHAGDQQEDGQDVRADTARQRRHAPRQRLPHHPAAGLDPLRVPPLGPRALRADAERSRRQPERDGQEQADRARAERPHRGQHGAQHQDRARGGQRDRNEVVRGAEQPAQALDGLRAGAAAVPPEVDEEGEEQREADEAESEQVELALLELGHVHPRGSTTGRGLASGLLLRWHLAPPPSRSVPNSCSARAKGQGDSAERAVT